MRRLVIVLAGLVTFTAVAIAGQSPRRAVPVTPWGDPDLQGTWSSEAEHKNFLKQASLDGELAFAGQRYRAVLEEVFA